MNGKEATENDPILALVNSQATSELAPLEVGQVVQTEQGGRLWSAKITRVLKDGRVRISYEGWDSSWDETVPRSRLRETALAPPVVTLHLQGGLTYRGTLTTSGDDFLMLQREDGSRVLVNRSAILAIEVPSAQTV